MEERRRAKDSSELSLHMHSGEPLMEAPLDRRHETTVGDDGTAVQTVLSSFNFGDVWIHRPVGNAIIRGKLRPMFTKICIYGLKIFMEIWN